MDARDRAVNPEPEPQSGRANVATATVAAAANSFFPAFAFAPLDVQAKVDDDLVYEMDEDELAEVLHAVDEVPPTTGGASAPAATSGDAGGASKRKRPHTAKACVNCRRRKARCHGGPPQCKTCTLYNDDCAWDDFTDGRRPASRSYVQALKNRILGLEAEVQRLRSAEGDGAGGPTNGGLKRERESQSASGAGRSGSAGDGASGSGEGVEIQVMGRRDSAEDVVSTMLHLKVSEDGEEVVFYGPTSAYAHSSPAIKPRDIVAPSDTSRPSSAPDAAHVDTFRRYLPAEPHLSTETHETVLTRFFAYFAAWGLRAHPIRFRADMEAHLAALTQHQAQLRSAPTAPAPSSAPPPLPRYAQYSPFLHNIILALALSWADEPELRLPEVRAIFAQRADEFLHAELRRPLPATVQGLAIKSSYLSTDGEHTAGWAYYGMGERIAQTLGLNVDCSPCVPQIMTPDEVKRRTETFWTIFIQEQTWAVYTGRPHSVSEYSTPLPEAEAELDDLPFYFENARPMTRRGSGVGRAADTSEEERKTSPMATVAPAPEYQRQQRSLVGTAFVECAKLALIMEKVMTGLYGLRSHGNKAKREGTVSDLSLELDSWAEALPASLAVNNHSLRNALPHILMLQLAREWITIFIHRPCYRLPSTSEDMSGCQNTAMEAVRRCDRSAARIVSLLATYDELYTLKYCPPTMFNIAFTAGTTFLLSALRHPTSSVKASGLSNAATCVGYLRLVGQSWTAALQKSRILQDLLSKYGVQDVLPRSLTMGATAGADLGTGTGAGRGMDFGGRLGAGVDSVWNKAAVDPAAPGARLVRGGSVREGKFKFPLPVNKAGRGKGKAAVVAPEESMAVDEDQEEREDPKRRRRSFGPAVLDRPIPPARRSSKAQMQPVLPPPPATTTTQAGTSALTATIASAQGPPQTVFKNMPSTLGAAPVPLPFAAPAPAPAPGGVWARTPHVAPTRHVVPPTPLLQVVAPSTPTSDAIHRPVTLSGLPNARHADYGACLSVAPIDIFGPPRPATLRGGDEPGVPLARYRTFSEGMYGAGADVSGEEGTVGMEEMMNDGNERFGSARTRFITTPMDSLPSPFESASPPTAGYVVEYLARQAQGQSQGQRRIGTAHATFGHMTREPRLGVGSPSTAVGTSVPEAYQFHPLASAPSRAPPTFEPYVPYAALPFPSSLYPDQYAHTQVDAHAHQPPHSLPPPTPMITTRPLPEPSPPMQMYGWANERSAARYGGPGFASAGLEDETAQWDSPPSEYAHVLTYLSSPHSGDPVGDSLWQNYTYSTMSTGPAPSVGSAVDGGALPASTVMGSGAPGEATGSGMSDAAVGDGRVRGGSGAGSVPPPRRSRSGSMAVLPEGSGNGHGSGSRMDSVDIGSRSGSMSGGGMHGASGSSAGMGTDMGQEQGVDGGEEWAALFRGL